MLFFIALLFSVAANAAPILSISDQGSTGVTAGTPTSGSLATLVYTVTSEPVISAAINTTESTLARIQWTVNPSYNVTINKGDGSPNVSFANGVYSYYANLIAGNPFVVGLTEALGTTIPAGDLITLSVAAVPVPAALWLFAPAVLGFFGLRRKSSKGLVAA